MSDSSRQETRRPHIFVATHHKSGTVWMVSTFRRIAKANNFTFNHLNTGESGWNIRPDKLEYFEQQRTIAESQSDLPAIFVDFHSAIPDLANCKATRGARGIHLIRDPRDMLLSATRYHLVSDEPWLLQPTKSFAGQTYQQKLSSYSTLEDQIQFEIDHHMGKAIREMHTFDRQDVFKDIKYEDLIVDADLTLFHTLCVHLQMQAEEIIKSLAAYHQSSIFGGMKPQAESGTHKHIRNAKPQQWKSHLSPKALDLIQSTFEHEILDLGYQLAD
jgi:hypothetical protein